MEIFVLMTPFQTVLKTLNTTPVLPASIAENAYVPLDLSLHNSRLKGVNVGDSGALHSYIWEHMKAHKVKVAYGGYLESRGIYQRSAYFNQEDSETERNIHLGIDLWIESETPIYAPLKGIIHSFKNNTNYGDYGPTLILEHHFSGITFYTLYGHLSLASLQNLEAGATVKQGEQIATLGTAKVNGDYPPHLHFQVIKDMQHFTGDYPGVSNLLNLDFYKQNCPDPNLLLGL